MVEMQCHFITDREMYWPTVKNLFVYLEEEKSTDP